MTGLVRLLLLGVEEEAEASETELVIELERSLNSDLGEVIDEAEETEDQTDVEPRT